LRIGDRKGKSLTIKEQKLGTVYTTNDPNEHYISKNLGDDIGKSVWLSSEAAKTQL